jgi:hypothetical protein
MRAFLVGLTFLIAAVVLIGAGILLFPLVIVLGFFLRVIFSFLFVIFAIWLLGRFIIFVWDKLRI